MYFAVRV